MPNINVSYEEMEQLARRVRSGAEESASQRAATLELLSNLTSNYVTDSASQSFAESVDRYAKASAESIDALDQIATYLLNAAQTFQETDASLSNLFRE